MEVKVGATVQSAVNPKHWGTVKQIWLATGMLTVATSAESEAATGDKEFAVHVSAAQAYVPSK